MSVPEVSLPATPDDPELGPAGRPADPELTARQLAAAVGAGLVAAAVLVDHDPGLGLGLTWLTVAAAVLATRPRATWAGAWRHVMLALAALAAGLPVVSDAGWYVAPALLVAVAAAVVGLSGGGSWLGLVRPSLRVVPVGLTTTATVLTAPGQAFSTDARRHPVVRATLLTVVLLAGFGALFASADRVFGALVERYLLPDLDLGVLPVRLGVLVVVAAGAATLVRLRHRAHDDRPLPSPARRLHGVEWMLPLGALVTLFAAFVALQFGVLFGGHERVLATAGLTYAEYARGGFGQLVVVAALTLAVLAAAGRYAAASVGREARLRQVLLAALCLLTLVVLVSAHHRLALYEDAFGSTRLRFAARFAIWWLAGVFALVLAAGAAGRARRLPRTVALTTAVAVVGIGYLQPDALIARWNVDRYLEEGRLDLDHLGSLSADAVPEMLRLPDDVRDCAVQRLAWRLDGVDRTWQAWNLARDRAWPHLGIAAAASPECPASELHRHR
ncbi:DUF4153 domain-containing protein [Egicoccus halophilus]|uniref:DUF4173 domain-containing protein n=1 Tax=Egicoccus halophilus TaxID=1670830 RepID=A0A8J3AFT1_9ACTN|nr:DUF4173 domain-containing protein [Egicoccus halophilus]GGI07119.1 hypothetical protein GCM10011354_22490 [Egicoccus halophilus]